GPPRRCRLPRRRHEGGGCAGHHHRQGMTAPTIYLVRHGQTDWNAEYRLQGQADTDLNETGRAQAGRNGRRLAGLVADPAGFDFVSSPMRRTRETMERLRAAMGLDPA